MIVPGSINPLLLTSAAAAGGFQVSRSLRFNSGDSAYLNRTPSVAGNRKTWTWSGWVKVSKQQDYPDQKGLFFAGSSNSNLFRMMFQGSNGQLRIDNDANGSNVTTLLTTQVFRDFSAWMHIVLAVDTTQATPSNRCKLYVNGTQVTTFSTETYQAQNTDTLVNSTNTHSIGNLVNHSPIYYFDGYLANVQLIDGQQLTPSSFTEVSATTGQLIPKAYTGGSYGTNGFYLKFADNSTTAALGTDSSGNGNTWTTNNFSVTAGAGNDSMVDTPTSYGTDTGVGNEVRGNYATLNPLNQGTSVTLSNGNLDVLIASGTGGASYRSAFATIGMTSGKWYFEMTVGALGSGGDFFIGISKDLNGNAFIGATSQSWGYEAVIGAKYNNATFIFAGYSTYTTGDTVLVAFDADNGRVFFGKNGVWQESGNPATGANAAYTGLTSGPYFFGCSTNNSQTINTNFGQRAFAYTAPSGFKALCDTNLGAPLVAKPNTLFDTILYSGNNSTQSITSLAFNPDMVWSKCRNVGRSHRLSDAIRGSNVDLYTDTTASDNFYGTGSITAFTANGFNLDNSASSQYNTSGETYVSWCWDAGTSTVSNTQGSITSQVRANPTAGFSVVTYTGNNTAGATVGHGLGVAPALIINKQRSGTNNWWTYHASLGATKYLVLDLANAAGTANTVWNDTAPTSTVFSIGVTGVTNTNSATYVSYCFAPVSGYSNFGSYVGNGSADGVFVFTGMRPRWILIKRSDSTNDWLLTDSARLGYNIRNELIWANLASAEYQIEHLDILSNGFKIRTTNAGWNASGGTYIYAAFAENPFQYARAR